VKVGIFRGIKNIFNPIITYICLEHQEAIEIL
jgi:hypothetical protein